MRIHRGFRYPQAKLPCGRDGDFLRLLVVVAVSVQADFLRHGGWLLHLHLHFSYEGYCERSAYVKSLAKLVFLP